jgi:hypothetical protein
MRARGGLADDDAWTKRPRALAAAMLGSLALFAAAIALTHRRPSSDAAEPVVIWMGMRSDGRCGREFGTEALASTTCGRGAPCCSSHGWCGASEEYCSPTLGCQSGCWPKDHPREAELRGSGSARSARRHADGDDDYADDATDPDYAADHHDDQYDGYEDDDDDDDDDGSSHERYGGRYGGGRYGGGGYGDEDYDYEGGHGGYGRDGGYAGSHDYYDRYPGDAVPADHKTVARKRGGGHGYGAYEAHGEAAEGRGDGDAGYVADGEAADDGLFAPEHPEELAPVDPDGEVRRLRPEDDGAAGAAGGDWAGVGQGGAEHDWDEGGDAPRG